MILLFEFEQSGLGYTLEFLLKESDGCLISLLVQLSSQKGSTPLSMSDLNTYGKIHSHVESEKLVCSPGVGKFQTHLKKRRKRIFHGKKL